MSKRAVWRREVARQLRDDSSVDLMRWYPFPPDPWFVHGPRGGLYIATGERTRRTVEDPERWDRNRLVIVDQSEGTRYVRPGSKLHKQYASTLPSQKGTP